MSAQHYMPAAFIGGFSLDSYKRARKRSVWVHRDGAAPYQASAEYVGHSERIRAISVGAKSPSAHRKNARTTIEQIRIYGFPGTICDVVIEFLKRLFAGVGLPC